MPSFYVDGLRDGQPSQVLYITAKNADAARAKAAELGMQVSAVRPAGEISNTKPLNLWKLPFFCCLSTLMCVLETMSNRSSGRPPTFTPLIVGTTILPMIFLIHQYLTKSNQRQQELQAEINDMRTQLLSRNLLDGRNS